MGTNASTKPSAAIFRALALGLPANHSGALEEELDACTAADIRTARTAYALQFLSDVQIYPWLATVTQVYMPAFKICATAHSFRSLSHDKQVLHTVISSACFLHFQYPRVSLKSCSCLPLLPCLPITSTPPYIFPSIMCLRRQFLRKTWPIKLAFLLFIACEIFLSSLTYFSYNGPTTFCTIL
jgi:hypothetical protein